MINIIDMKIIGLAFLTHVVTMTKSEMNEVWYFCYANISVNCNTICRSMPPKIRKYIYTF